MIEKCIYVLDHALIFFIKLIDDDDNIYNKRHRNYNKDLMNSLIQF